MRIVRSTFSILFYINRGKIKADGTTAVMCRITIDGRNTAITTGICCKPEDWNARTGTIRTVRENARLQEGVPEVYRTDLRGNSEDAGCRQCGDYQEPGDKAVRRSDTPAPDGRDRA